MYWQEHTGVYDWILYSFNMCNLSEAVKIEIYNGCPVIKIQQLLNKYLSLNIRILL